MQQNNFEFTQIEIEQNLKKISERYKQADDKASEEMADFFTARINMYDEHMKSNFEIYKHLPELFSKTAEKLLDLGCGTGLELDEIFKAHPDIEVTGIDMTRAMLDELMRKHSDKNINLFCTDYFKHDFGEGEYDVVISVQSLHHFKYDKKREIYRKIYHALKPEGVYIECDYMASSEEHEKLCHDFCDKQRAKHAVPDDTFVHIDIPLTVNHQMELIRNANFRIVSLVHRIKNTVTLVARK